MKTTQQVAKTIIAGLAASLALAAPLHAQTGQKPPMPDKSGMGTMDKAGTMDTGGKMGGGGMMQMHEKMQADTKAMDDELDTLVAKMNHASDGDKEDAMAAVITKMAQQRKTMDQKMAAMQTSMMQGMMGNMGGGMMGGGMKKPMKMHHAPGQVKK